MQENTSSQFNFTKVFEYCLLALVFLVPLAFVPNFAVSLYSAKIALISLVAVIFVGSFLASTLSSGRISFPKSKLLIPIMVFPVVALVSSFFSGVLVKSSIGQVFDLGTSASFVILSLLLFLAVFAVREARVGVKVFYALIFSSLIVVLHLLLRIFALSLPEAFATRISNFLVGGPTDTAVFLGATVIASLSVLNYLEVGRKMKYLLYFILAVSLLYIGSTGFLPIIILLGLFALVYFVYVFSWSVNQSNSQNWQGSENGENNGNEAVGTARFKTKGFESSFPSLLVLIVSVVFILSGSSLSNYLSGVFKVNLIEVRPNVESTVSLIGASWKQNPLLGVGPNMFKEFWDLKKPLEINNTQFWNTDFDFGAGFVPTVAVTTGVLGTASILAFFGLFVYLGYKAIFYPSEGESRFVSSTSFFVAFFFWLIAFVYSGGLSIIALTFIFSGVFIASLSMQRVVEQVEINIFKNPKSNFASVFIIVVLLISSVSGGYFIWERVVASALFNKGSVDSAVRIVGADLYLRGFSENSMARINGIISSSPSGELGEQDRVALQTAVSDSIAGVQEAIKWNPKNFQNWFALGRVYEILAANGLEGASENAKAAYAEATLRSPNNPAVPLALSRLSALEGNFDGARVDIQKALELKGNYTDAYFTLAQLEVSLNNTAAAIRSVEAATLLDPGNAGLYFQLGLLKYNSNDFSGSARAFDQATLIVSDYANARYFLGLSYERLGRDAEAIAEFEELKRTNSDNQEIDLILSNLRSGRAPFAGAEPPIDTAPEDREVLPLEE